MTIPFEYVIKNFYARKLTTAITLMGITLVVAVFAAVLMLAYGVKKTLAATGSENNIIVTRKSATGEITSIIDRETASIIYNMPEVSKGADGKALATSDVITIVNLDKIGVEGALSNIPIRGVSPAAFTIRENVHITSGRTFNPGTRELVVGSAVSAHFKGAKIGDKIKLANDEWSIVGVMEANGSGFESEFWGDCEQLLQAYKRTAFSTVTFRLNSGASLETLKNEFSVDPRLNQFQVETERSFFMKASEFLTEFITYLGLFVTIIFSTGAIIGAMITMYSAVANRTVEIGTLRAIGFTRVAVMIAFLLETLIIAILGGVLGLILASLLSFLSLSTMNFGTFSELAFTFSLSPAIIIESMSFAILMGFAGGFLPAWGAARLKIVDALRAM